jgi:hypothetical protein
MQSVTGREIVIVRSNWKPILALLLVAPFLTELLSGNLPASQFFQPQVYVFLATAGYGFPILLLREFAVRRQLGLAGLFALGLVYGIFNEGILAKTFYLAIKVPIGTFDGYGYVFGIAIPWAITISIWHALHSFVYPIVTVCYFFPEHRQSPWLSRRAIVLIAIPTILVGMLTFFHEDKDHAGGRAAQFVAMITLSGLLIWLATKLESRPAMGDSGMLQTPAIVLGGLAFLAFLFVPIVLAAVKIPVSVFYAYNFILVALMLWLLHQRESFPLNNVMLFAIGDDALMALAGLAGAMVRRDIQRMVANLAFLALFGWLWMRLRKQSAYLKTGA